MKNVEVLLRQNVKDLGRVGDVVKVAAGYARNYLIPSQMAARATPEMVKAMAKRREKSEAEEAAQRAQYQGVLDTLTQLSLKTAVKADEKGHLFGSVNVTALAKLLEEAGHPVEESQIRLAEPIKTIGTHSFPVHVHGELAAAVTVEVEAEA
jgi:large subunit ribosomal protein L9